MIAYRNLSGRPFVASAPPNACEATAALLLPLLPAGPGSRRARLVDCPPSVLRMLRERGLIPANPVVFPGKGGGKWILLRPGLWHWDLVNEVEHLTSSRVFPGMPAEAELTKAYIPPMAGESAAAWAWHRDFGFLNSHPSRIGPGLELEALVHLPALVRGNCLPQAWNSMFAMGLTCRPHSHWGEPLPRADLFHVQTRGGLGGSPEDLYGKFFRSITDLLAWEADQRRRMSEKHHKGLAERIQQSHQALLSASNLAYPRLLELGSWLRLGAYLGTLPAQTEPLLEELRVIAAPGHLGVSSGSELDKEDEDILRANVVRLSLERQRAA